MRYRYPLHVHISTLFLLLILFLCIVLGWIGFALSSNLLEASAARLTAGISREALLEMRRVIEPAEVVTRLLSQQRVTTATSLQRRLDSLTFLQQALAGSSALSSLYVGYDNGDFFLFGRVDQGSQSEAAKAPAGATYVVQSIERSGPVARGRFIYLDAALQTLREDDRPDYAAAYDPRNRIWFTEGLASSTQIKTPPYLFFSSGKVGTTLANRSADGRSVVGADILLHTLGEILAREKVTPGSQMVLVNAQGYVLAYADDAQMLRDAAASDGRSALARIDELGVPALVPLLETVRKLRGQDSHTWSDKIGDHRVVVNRLSLEGVPPLYLVTAIPESELMAGAWQLVHHSAIAALGVLLLSIIAHLAARAQHFAIAEQGWPEKPRRSDTSSFRAADRRRLLDSRKSPNWRLTMDGMKTTIRPFSRHQPGQLLPSRTSTDCCRDCSPTRNLGFRSIRRPALSGRGWHNCKPGPGCTRPFRDCRWAGEWPPTLDDMARRRPVATCADR
jgi:hypothetical protein